jgi:signal transduction histidine kinase
MEDTSLNGSDAAFYRAFNALLVDCTSLIVQSDENNFNDRMDQVLGKIGLFSQVDRAYYFTVDQNSHTSSNTNEWCKEGVEPQIEYLQNIPFEVVPNWIEFIQAGKEIYIDDLEKLDEKWTPEKEILEPQGIQSLLSIPVRESEYLYGFIGFDAVGFKVKWTDDSRHLLRILADNIGSVIRRNIQNQELNKRTKELEKTQASLEALNKDLENKVIEKTREYIKLTEAYNEQEKLAAIGETAAGVAHDLNTPISNVLLGVDALQSRLRLLLEKQLVLLPQSEILFALDIATNTPPEAFVSSFQLEKDKQEILGKLSNLVGFEDATLLKVADTMARCRIVSNEKITEISKYSQMDHLMDLIENMQTSFSLIDTISHSAYQSAAVIKNLRDYLNKSDFVEKVEVNLYKSISSALEVFSLSTDKQLQMEIGIPKDYFIYGYEIKLFQLWSNLIKNAIEALRKTADPRLKITANKKENEMIISFENNGPVISEEEIKKIFNRFYTTKSVQEGMGLGLSIIQKVIHEHGGNIHIQSDEQSTIFNLEFPLQ